LFLLRVQGNSPKILFSYLLAVTSIEADFLNYIGAELGGDPGEDPGHTGGIISPGWPVNASGSPRMSWKMLWVRGKSGSACWVCCPRDPTPE